MASLTAETQKFLHNASTAGVEAIADKLVTAQVPAASFDGIPKIEQHRWHWRPAQPRLILVAK